MNFFIGKKNILNIYHFQSFIFSPFTLDNFYQYRQLSSWSSQNDLSTLNSQDETININFHYRYLKKLKRR